jgi:hypothetical protein
MYLKDKGNGDLVEVIGLDELFDPNLSAIKGRYHAGEEMPDTQRFNKADLQFPSGEALPRCWLDPGYRD